MDKSALNQQLYPDKIYLIFSIILSFGGYSACEAPETDGSSFYPE